MNRTDRAAIQAALEDVYAGDQSLEAGAVADRLEDAGWVLRQVAPGFAPADPSLPFASTKGLPRMANP